MRIIRLICCTFIIEALPVAVCGAVSYGEAVGKPKKFSYRGGSNIAEPSERTSDAQRTNDESKQALAWADGDGDRGYVDEKGNAHDNDGRKIGIVVPPNYAIFKPPVKVKANGLDVDAWYQGTDGAIYDKNMNRIKPETCKGTGEEEVCTEDFLDDLQEKLYDTLQAAVLAKRNDIVGSECTTKTEASHLVLRTKATKSSSGGKYLVTLKSRFADKGKSAHSAPGGHLPYSMSSKYEVVADIHNHPPNNIGKDWFSVQDALSAWGGKIDAILYGCASDVFLWLHHDDGRVTQIVNERSDEPAIKWFVKNKSDGSWRVGEKSYSVPKGYDYSSSAYDPDEWGTDDFIKFYNRKYNSKAKSDSIECGGVVGAEIGVYGWCDCGDDHGKRYIVGDMFCMYDKLKCDLAYTLCGRCGCVVCPKDCAGEGLQIMDVKLYKELKQKNGGKLAWSDAFEPLKARQSKIESIPNGQIVVRGLCTCKVADPIKVGFTNKITEEFYVCCNCGRVREPDENGGVQNGPTALSEMGLNEQAEKETERIRNWLEDGKSSK